MSKKVIVTVNEGKVRGFKGKTAYSGVEYYSFLGIPYGQSTAGSSRYKDPVKVKAWENVLDATKEKGGCLQFSLLEKKIIGSEDCLYSNIHTTKLPSEGYPLKAVIVNLHPGAGVTGTPDPSFGGAPDFVMHNDIVYVCLGYRLHAYGFLNLHTEDCSGNQALKDITLGLQWIKENINNFGGDPDNVTLMGSSSGSTLVHHILLSPMAKGLFHKAILMGSYIFSPVIEYEKDHVSLAYEIAKKVGYAGPPAPNRKLLNFYKKVDFSRISMMKPENLFNKSTLQVYPASFFKPTPEPGESSPLPTSPEKLIPSMNRVPIIIGFCKREACMAISLLRTFKSSLSNGFRMLINQNKFAWGADLNDNELRMVQSEVENFYLDGKPLETATQSILSDILTDAALSDVYDSLINVIAADLPSSVYVYNFHYDGKLCMLKRKLIGISEQEMTGAFHAADYSYWNHMEDSAGKNMTYVEPRDRKIIDTFTSLLTTFAKKSNPNYEGMQIDWKPTTPDHPSHLIIDETLQVKDELLNGERMQFWHKLKSKFKKHRNNL